MADSKKRKPYKGRNKSSKVKSYSNKKDKESKSEVKISQDSVNENLNINDPSWYFRDPVLKTGLTRMPTFEFLGSNIPNGIAISSPILSDDEKDMMECEIQSPTLAVHFINPSPGVSSSLTSAINRASRMLYSKLSASNAKTSSYAPQDVSTLLLAIGELISGINDMTRLYGITNYYTKLNRSIPSVFLRAYNITDEKAWISELPNFRARLNKLIVNANAISFPSNYPYFKKCAYVYQHVYRDNESNMTAYHMMRPYSTWEIDETSFEGGTILKTVVTEHLHPTVNGSTAADVAYMTRLEDLLDSLLTSITYNYIYADIINLLNRGVLGSELLSFATIPIDYWVEPIYNDQYNWQMMNEHIYRPPTNKTFTNCTPSNDVYPDPDTNSLFYRPFWETAAATQWWGAIVDFHNPVIRVPGIGVSEDDLIECLAYAGSQNINVYQSTTAQDQLYTRSLSSELHTLPDHYVVQVRVYRGSVDNTPFVIGSNLVNAPSNASFGDFTLITAICGEFDHFPLLHTYVSFNTSTTGYRVPTGHRIYGQLKVYTTDMNDAINNIRFAGLLGLFTPENF